MTATCTFSQFSSYDDFHKSRHGRHLIHTYQADVVDFDGENYSLSFEAADSDEAEEQAQRLCTSLGIDAYNICVYQY